MVFLFQISTACFPVSTYFKVNKIVKTPKFFTKIYIIVKPKWMENLKQVVNILCSFVKYPSVLLYFMEKRGYCTWIQLFYDKFNLSVHIWLVIFDKATQDFLHTLYQKLPRKITYILMFKLLQLPPLKWTLIFPMFSLKI